MKTRAPPEAFTRAHAVDDEMPGLPEREERPPLSPFRWTWRSSPHPELQLTEHEGPLGALRQMARMEGRMRDGTIFREMRTRLQLGLQEVADGWGVSAVEVGEVERGLRGFPETDDLNAALQQLWMWHMERRGQCLASSRGGA